MANNVAAPLYYLHKCDEVELKFTFLRSMLASVDTGQNNPILITSSFDTHHTLIRTGLALVLTALFTLS